jgi:beta-mannosidase
MELRGRWQATLAVDDLRRSLADPAAATDDWHEVTVPGHWRQHGALAATDGPVGYVHHFTVTDEEVICEHALTPSALTADERRWWLVTEGIFSEADIWLDNSYLGDTAGYFAHHTFDVTEQVGSGSDHTLVAEVSCRPAGTALPRRSLLGVFEGGTDLLPQGNPGGIWRPVRLVATGPVRVQALRTVCREASAERASVACRAVLWAAEATTVTLVTTIGTRERSERSQPLAAGANEIEWTVTVDQPERWWPAGLGAQHLHDLHVAVLLDGGRVSDRAQRRIGLRTVELRKWSLRINGERLFTRGVNLAPAAPYLAAADALSTRQVDQALELGANLARVYGHVGTGALYRHADERGLLLWQDLPLVGPAASTVRPQATRQARAMVDQLAQHPSIVLWCGHVGAAGEWMRSGGTSIRERVATIAANELPTLAKSVLDRAIKRVLVNADGSRPVFGYTGVWPHPPRLDASPSHLWFGWRGGSERDLDTFAARLPSLVSWVAELGAQSVPTGAAFLDSDGWPDLDWPDIAARYGMDTAAFARYVPPFGHPSPHAWAEATQLYQALVVRRQIETLRRLKYRPTGGVCVHFLADATAAVSSSLIDADGRPKLARHAVAAAFAPVIVVADRLPPTVDPGTELSTAVHVVSDRREPLRGAVVEAVVMSGVGDTAVPGARWRFGGDIPPDACIRVGSVRWHATGAPGRIHLDLRVLDGSGAVLATNRYDTELR